MRYDYECGACNLQFEVVCAMSDRRDEVACQCGGTARQIFTTVPCSFVRGRPLQLDPTLSVPSFGRAFGRSDQEQHEGHRRAIEEQRKAVHSWNTSHSAKDKQFEFVGCAPMEAVLSFNDNVGDKEAAQSDPVDFYKRLGTYMGRS